MSDAGKSSAPGQSAGYGNRLAAVFGEPLVHSTLNRSLKAGLLAATEVRDDAPDYGISSSIPCEDAFLATLHLREIGRHTAWEAGRQYPVRALRVGDTLIRDLKRDPTVLVDNPHHEIHFYLPRAALDAMADDCEARRIDDLAYVAGEPIRDQVIAGIGESLREAFEFSTQANTLFLDHLLSAIAVHIAASAGGMSPGNRSGRARLSMEQERRSKEMLCSDLSGEIRMADLARECGLSAGYFRRAFQASTGLAPHQWLIRRRLDVAKAELRDGRMPLAEVALACGFCDQSHFTRVFCQHVGVSPGRWRASQ